MARQKFVYNKKLGKVVPLVEPVEKPRKLSRKEQAKAKRNRLEIRALCRAKAVTVVDSATGKTVNVARSGTRSRAKWPIISDAMAVDPKNISKARELLRRAGVSTEYTPTGEPILRSARHRRDHAKVMGFYDRNAGICDPAPVNYTGQR